MVIRRRGWSVKKILIGVAAVLGLAMVGLVGAVALQPDKMHVERSVVIDAAPQDVWSVVADYKRFADWSPWQELDPQMHVETSEPSTGVGASHFWKGNSDVGTGRMTITEAEPNVRMVERLEFMEPFADVSTATFTLAPDGDRTKVTWAMDGDQAFMEKGMWMLVDMDAMLGADFQKGMDKLKAVVEPEAKARKEKEEADRLAAEAAATAAAAAVPTDAVAPQ